MNKNLKNLMIVMMVLGSFSGYSSKLAVKEIVSANGIKAWFTPEPQLPIVSLAFSFKAGTLWEPEHQAGISHILAQMLMEGTAQQSSHEYKSYLMDHPIQIVISSDADHINALCRVSLEYLPKAVEILKQILYHPRFDSRDLNRIISQTRIDISSSMKDPQQRVDYEALKKLIGTHPYAYSDSHIIQSIKGIKADHLRHFKKKNFTQDRLNIGICGHLTQDEAASLVDDLFKDLPKLYKGAEALKACSHVQKSSTHIYENIPQSMIVMVHPSLKITHPDFMKLYILSHVIGGNMNSRLWQSIREQQGLAYQIDLQLKLLDQLNYLKICLGTDSSKTERAIAAVQKVWLDIQTNGITQGELDEAKMYLNGSFSLSFVNSSSIAQTLNVFQNYGYNNPAYFQERKAMIERITLQQINDFAKSFFDVNRLKTSTIGKHKISQSIQNNTHSFKKEK